MDSLVSTDWLAGHLGDPDLRIVDASWFMPASGRKGVEEFREAHIPGAVFLDIDGLSDKSNPAPHMLPSARDFGEAMGSLGIGRDDRIVVYDNSPVRTAARGWFMLRQFGARNVAILDGGFQKWTVENRPVESGGASASRSSFAAEPQAEIVTKRQIIDGLTAPLLDARGRPRFEGSAPDPRPGVEPGGSRAVPVCAR